MPQLAEKFLPSKLSKIGFIVLALTAAGFAALKEPLAAAAAASTAGLFLTGMQGNRRRQTVPGPQLRTLFFISLNLALFAALWRGPWVLSHWLYALPLITFGFVPAYPATIITVAGVIFVVSSTQWVTTLPDRHQMISAFVLSTLLGAILIFLQKYKDRQLKPLRRTDRLTQAASREYLSADLHKEIQRSEREGTHLSAMAIGLDAHVSDTAPDADISAILPRIGRYLHSQLRDFDTYYRMADLQFLAILPGSNTAEAADTAERIRNGLCTIMASHGLKLTVSAGVAGLNIGDDADSLQISASNALRRAQQHGGNRTQTYSNPVPSDRSGTKGAAR
ncbi:GGDEF domain-containing protein [Marinobacter sp.]|uniref:GGDEF domain-containing protein n=1 Tax=Marinobacter sp. TaxID=50741 RepID=UPI002B274A49|nr:GGDEF domain-containing protein [Marinobacter sp.]